MWATTSEKNEKKNFKFSKHYRLSRIHHPSIDWSIYIFFLLLLSNKNFLIFVTEFFSIENNPFLVLKCCFHHSSSFIWIIVIVIIIIFFINEKIINRADIDRSRFVSENCRTIIIIIKVENEKNISRNFFSFISNLQTVFFGDLIVALSGIRKIKW